MSSLATRQLQCVSLKRENARFVHAGGIRSRFTPGYCLLLLGLGLLLACSGCAALVHDLHPHRLQRLNRGAPPSIDPEFTLVIRDDLLHLT